MRIRLSLVPGPVVRRQELASRRKALLLIPLLAIASVAVFYVLLVNDARRAREVIRDTESRLAPLRLTAAQVGFAQDMGYNGSVSNYQIPDELKARIGFTPAEEKALFQSDYAYLAKEDSQLKDWWDKVFKA